jgi:hypothetical protein
VSRGGIHEDECPPTPLLPGFEETLEVHDGCAGQYAGKRTVHDGCAGQYAGNRTFHQAAEWRTKTGVGCTQLRLETMRSKGGCDGVSNVVPNAVHNALINEELLDLSD